MTLAVPDEKNHYQIAVSDNKVCKLFSITITDVKVFRVFIKQILKPRRMMNKFLGIYLLVFSKRSSALTAWRGGLVHGCHRPARAVLLCTYQRLY